MTTASAAGNPGRRHAAAMWLGHYADEMMITSMALYGAGTIFLKVLPDAAQWALMVTLFPFMQLSVAALIMQHLVHDRNLCMRDVARAPLADPEGEVQRRMRWLRRFHGRYRKLMALAPLLLIAVMAGALALPAGGQIVQQVALVAFVSFAAFQMQVSRVHRRLRPWCPMCRWGRGDDGDGPQEPSPVTPPANVHSVG